MEISCYFLMPRFKMTTATATGTSSITPPASSIGGPESMGGGRLGVEVEVVLSDSIVKLSKVSHISSLYSESVI